MYFDPTENFKEFRIAKHYFAGMRKDFDQPSDRQSIMDKYGTFGLDSLSIYVQLAGRYMSYIWSENSANYNRFIGIEFLIYCSLFQINNTISSLLSTSC